MLILKSKHDLHVNKKQLHPQETTTAHPITPQNSLPYTPGPSPLGSSLHHTCAYPASTRSRFDVLISPSPNFREISELYRIFKILLDKSSECIWHWGPGGPTLGGIREPSGEFSRFHPDHLNHKFYQQGLGLFLSRLPEAHACRRTGAPFWTVCPVAD